MQYQDFLSNKKISSISTGFNVELSDINPMLFDFQKALVRWSIGRGRSAIFADTGLGKTPMQTTWADLVAKHTHKPVLILAPLSVAHQTIREAAKFGIEANYHRSQPENMSGIIVTNYEMMDRFNFPDFSGLVLDECFPFDMPIDVLNIDGVSQRKHIKDIRKGDKILNACGVDIVSDIHRREVTYAIKVNFNGRSIISSPNHPYFTQRGWVGACNLQSGDYLLETSSAMRMVQNGFYSEGLCDEHSQVLREILLSEMADESTGEFSENSQSGSCCKEGKIEIGMAEIGRSEGENRVGSHTEFESYVINGNEREGLPNIESHEAQTFCAWGKRSWFDSSSADSKGCAIRELDSGICFVTGETSSGISNMLQNRLGVSSVENSNRSGWINTPQQERSGQEKGCGTGFIGVDGIEILEQGHPELEKYRDAEGKLYFYDIGATQHPSFSIDGILVHNSSILKSHDGKTRSSILEASLRIPFRLSCTATPSPNDFMELGNQAEFVGVMSREEMLAMFFIHDGGDTAKWRLKGHGEEKFWEWLSTWAVVIRKPSDIGFDDSAYDLPTLHIHEHIIEVDRPSPGQLFALPAIGLNDQRAAKRESMADRVDAVSAIVNQSQDSWLVWCHMNAESDALDKSIGDAITVSGSDTIEHKEMAMDGFTDGKYRVLVSKPKICGYGMNWQHCNSMAFVGLDHSFESFYQAIRRCWRFGQTRPVNVHIYLSDVERPILDNIKRKESQHDEMSARMVEHMRGFMQKEIFGMIAEKSEYIRDVATGENWELHLGDCVEVSSEIESGTIDYTIFSPPFSSLYTYSNSDRDMGNSKSGDEFFRHFGFLVKDMLRITKEGRLCSVHCMNLPSSKQNDGYIGIKDFRGDIIRLFQSHGWIYHSEVCIWKDPVTAMQRTKALGLLHKTIRKDSAMSRQGIPDYLVTFRKPGLNPDPIAHTHESFPVGLWQKYASPVWFDINATRTLQYMAARCNEDERHICPLQLDVIERGIELWSNPGDLVFSPFTGIGSEGFTALKMGRKFIGSELKKSYFDLAVKNLKQAKCESGDLFAEII